MVGVQYISLQLQLELKFCVILPCLSLNHITKLWRGFYAKPPSFSFIHLFPCPIFWSAPPMESPKDSAIAESQAKVDVSGVCSWGGNGVRNALASPVDGDERGTESWWDSLVAHRSNSYCCVVEDNIASSTSGEASMMLGGWLATVWSLEKEAAMARLWVSREEMVNRGWARLNKWVV